MLVVEIFGRSTVNIGELVSVGSGFAWSCTTLAGESRVSATDVVTCTGWPSPMGVSSCSSDLGGAGRLSVSAIGRFWSVCGRLGCAEVDTATVWGATGISGCVAGAVAKLLLAVTVEFSTGAVMGESYCSFVCGLAVSSDPRSVARRDVSCHSLSSTSC